MLVMYQNPTSHTHATYWPPKPHFPLSIGNVRQANLPAMSYPHAVALEDVVPVEWRGVQGVDG